MIKSKEKVKKLAKELLDNEVIFKADLIDIFGERKWKSFEEEQLLKLDEENNKKNK